MEDKHILVTGSAGSLGSEICKQLEFYPNSDDCAFIGLDKNDGPEVGYQCDILDPDDYDWRYDEEYDNFRRFDVIHCAANIYGVGGFNAHCADILGKDIEMTRQMLDFFVSRPNRGRFVYLSSSMVYERVKGDPYLTEIAVDDFPAPLTEYGLSKFTGERLVKAYAKQYGIEYTIWRPFNIITPYEVPEGDKSSQGYSHVFADFFNNILVKKLNPLPIIGDGNQVRCFTWYEEVAECIVHNLMNEGGRILSTNEIFNIGNQEPVRMVELANMIVNTGIEMGLVDPDIKLGFVTTKTYPNDVQIRIPAINKAKTMLNWEAKIKTKESVERCMKVWANRLTETK